MNAQTAVSPLVIALPYLPDSLNRLQYAHWTRRRAAKRRLQSDLEGLLLAARLPRGITYLTASVTLLVPDRRRRDEGNYRTPLEKALGDALVNGAWLPDDTPEHFKFGAAVFEHRPDVRAALVRLAWRAT